MKRVFCICILTVFIICAVVPTSAHTPQSSRTYQSADDTGVYSVRFNGKHADITRFASHTLDAYVDLYASIRSVCAYRGKIVFLCEDVRRNQLSVYVYYLDTDYLEGFVINNELLYNNTDFACDNDAIYIENYRDNHEIFAFSYSGDYLGRYRLDGEVNALCGGYRSGFYAVGSDTLYSFSSGRFNALSGASVETPLFPADSHILVSGYGSVYLLDGNQVTYAFSVDSDSRAASACVIGNMLYYPNGNTINAYDLDTGEKIAYYRTSGQVISVFADGNTIIAVGDSSSVSISQDSFTSLIEQEDAPEEEGADGDSHQQGSSGSGSGGGTSNQRVNQSQSQNQNNGRSGPSSISSDVYQVDSARFYISGIPPQTTVAKFKANMNYDGYSVTIYRGNAVKKSGNVGTGMTAVFSSDEFIYTYELGVTGDITGEGSCNSRDLTTLMDYLIGSTSFNGVYIIAADLTNDSIVDVCDLATLKSII